MTPSQLHELPSYRNSTFGTPTPPPVRQLAHRLRTHEPCPRCGRHEESRWWSPCPAQDCPSHGPQEAL